MVSRNNKDPLLIINYQFLTSDALLFGLIVKKSDYNITFIIKQLVMFQLKRVYQVS